MEKWKERVDEAEVHEWAAENAPKNPDLRDALNAIMEHLDVLARAEAGLDEEEAPGFRKPWQRSFGNLAICSDTRQS